MGAFSFLGSSKFRALLVALILFLVFHRLRHDDIVNPTTPEKEISVEVNPANFSGMAPQHVATVPPPLESAPVSPKQPVQTHPRLCCNRGCEPTAEKLKGSQWLPSDFLDPTCGHGLQMKIMMPDDCPALRPPEITYAYQSVAGKAENIHGQSRVDRALKLLEESPQIAFNVSAAEQFVVDFSFLPSQPYSLPLRFPRWTFLTAFLPDRQRAALKTPLAPNHIMWNPATAFRLKALSTTMNMFDYGLVLRTDELVALAPLHVILGFAVPMSRRTVVMLPCNVSDDQKLITTSLNRATGNKVGLQRINFTVSAIAQVTGECTKTLWLVQVLNITKGVKHSWCDHSFPWNWKFNFSWSVGMYPTLTLTHGLHEGEVRTLRHWMSNINLSELFAWGVAPAQRWKLLWDAFNYPSYPDAAVMNWLLAAGGRLVRIDWDNPFMSVLRGAEYTKALLGQFCLPPPQFGATCSCCERCFNWKWSPHPVPIECQACFLCKQHEFHAAFSAHAFERLITGADGNLDAVLQDSLECGHNSHVGHKYPQVACYPYTLRTEQMWHEQRRKR
eukprot:TRINITY_DN13631_c0_g1_i2.p1 TRINITY_DN13631_c0_g1~~TRINITY_DN13631_c0_g1_i2.p1  ORF type:complete len:559 (-),score=40.82 TRINITY_DN13631_c0_g1_i2:1040-2716(-)